MGSAEVYCTTCIDLDCFLISLSLDIKEMTPIRLHTMGKMVLSLDGANRSVDLSIAIMPESLASLIDQLAQRGIVPPKSDESASKLRRIQAILNENDHHG